MRAGRFSIGSLVDSLKVDDPELTGMLAHPAEALLRTLAWKVHMTSLAETMSL